MKQNRPDVFIPIDFQGFNMLLCVAARRLNIPTIYYISPQEWQWGTQKGGKKVIENTTNILSIFKEEEEFYKKLGGKATYIGHPLKDIVQSSLDKESFYEKYKIDPEKRIVSVFPGARPQEVKHVFPTLLKAAKNLREIQIIRIGSGGGHATLNILAQTVEVLT